jgi:hypothetical protein
MSTFAPNRETLESFVDCIHGGVDEDTLSRLLACSKPAGARLFTRGRPVRFHRTPASQFG